MHSKFHDGATSTMRLRRVREASHNGASRGAGYQEKGVAFGCSHDLLDAVHSNSFGSGDLSAPRGVEGRAFAERRIQRLSSKQGDSRPLNQHWYLPA